MFSPGVPPPEWDQQQDYLANNLVVYATTHRRRLLKVGKKMTLRDVFKASKEKEGAPRDGLELKGDCLTFVVLPKGGPEGRWVEEYKKMREKSS
jgi:small subunit ribosomal protein S7e